MQLTVQQVARELKLSEQRIRVLVKGGRFPGAWKAGARLWIIPRAAVDEYIAVKAAKEEVK